MMKQKVSRKLNLNKMTISDLETQFVRAGIDNRTTLEPVNTALSCALSGCVTCQPCSTATVTHNINCAEPITIKTDIER